MALVLSDVQERLIKLINEVVTNDENSGYQMYPSSYRDEATNVVLEAIDDDDAVRTLWEWSFKREWLCRNSFTEFSFALNGPLPLEEDMI